MPTPDKLVNPKQEHPLRAQWREEEGRQRASFMATRRALAHFLVPHRHEGGQTKEPTELLRARYGYGVGLNRTWLTELMGHVARASRTFSWGTLLGTAGQQVSAGDQQGDGMVGRPPADTVAAMLWDDATRDGTSWSQFWNEGTLEWILSSPGALVVVDNPSKSPIISAADVVAQQVRPYLRRVPFSAVQDYGMGPNGFTWVRLMESRDERQPDMAPELLSDPGYDKGTGMTKYVTLYMLEPDGTTLARRYKFGTGEPASPEVNMGKIQAPAGYPILPVLPAIFGEHQYVAGLGTGLLDGLADIVLDLFNVLNEIRTGYRDSVFSIDVVKGAGQEDFDTIVKYLQDGAQVLPLGDNPDAEFTRVAADAGEVEAGLLLFTEGLKAWALAAKGKVQLEQAGSDARSGESFEREFQIDLKPLLVRVAGALDQCETNVMYVAAQLAGASFEQVKDTVGVVRDTHFRLEDEASRLARIVTEFLQTELPLPPTAARLATMRWLETSGLFDLDSKVAGENGKTLRDVLEAEAEDDAQAAADRRRRMADMASVLDGLGGSPPDGSGSDQPGKQPPPGQKK